MVTPSIGVRLPRRTVVDSLHIRVASTPPSWPFAMAPRQCQTTSHSRRHHQSRSASTKSRSIHSTHKASSSVSSSAIPAIASYPTSAAAALSSTHHPSSPVISKPHAAPLSVLPLMAVLRSLATNTISASPLLLPPSLRIMSILANTSSWWLNPDKNPVLGFLIKNTFYAQFCAGANEKEVQSTIQGLKNIGFAGVILCYAREVVMTEAQKKDLASGIGLEEETAREEVLPWAEGTLETVRLTPAGDYVAIKFTGAGRQALHSLTKQLPPSAILGEAIDRVCDLAASRNVRLLFDAEQSAVQAGIDDWTLKYMRKYNTAERTTIFGTYQSYLKSCPETLSRHLQVAQKEGFALGVKLVRGAYLNSDPRHLIHDSKEDTDACFDGLSEALLREEWMSPLQGTGPFPRVSTVLASHNAESVQKAREVLSSRDGKSGEVAFAQLQGMADEISCTLLAKNPDGVSTAEKAQAYKYLVWGSPGECMKYLLRRAHENRDAMGRTRAGRDAMRSELWRRCKSVFGLA